MRVRVFFCRTAMRRPAGVSNAVSTVEGFEADCFFQIAQFAFGAPDLQPCSVASHCNAS